MRTTNLIKKPVEIRLTEDEVQNALDFIHNMRETKQKHNSKDMMFDLNNTSEGINIVGHLGEIAAAKYLEVTVNQEIYIKGDDGTDLDLNGISIQVKTSKLPKLIFNKESDFATDVAVLSQFVGKDNRHAEKDPVFHLWGWITKEEFMDKYYQYDFGYGTRLVVESIQLKPIEELKE